MSVLFLTATGHPEANLNSVWHLFSKKTQINRIVVLTTDFTVANKQATYLLALLPSLFQVTVEALHLPDGIEEKKVDQIKQIVMQWLALNQPESVLFNVTGGTKLISIALDHVAQMSSRYECFYQSRDNHIVWYTRPVNHIYKLDPPDDIAMRLKSRGFNITKPDTDLLKLPIEQLQYALKMYDFLMENFSKAQRLTTLINALASNVDHNEQSLKQAIKPDKNYSDLKDWLGVLAGEGSTFFSHDEAQGSLSWTSQDAADFMKGTWFEVLVGYLVYRSVSEVVSTVHVNFEFEKNGVKNETDVAFIVGSHLHFLECKTVKWKDKTAGPNQALYKFNTISQVAGLNQRISLVTLYEISSDALQRAKEMGIQVVQGKDILNLKDYLNTEPAGVVQ